MLATAVSLTSPPCLTPCVCSAAHSVIRQSCVEAQAKAKATPNKASKTDAGSVAAHKIDSPQKQGKKRSAAEAVDVVDGAVADSPKRQKQVDADATEADLQVCSSRC